MLAASGRKPETMEIFLNPLYASESIPVPGNVMRVVMAADSIALNTNGVIYPNQLQSKAGYLADIPFSNFT